MKKIIYLLITVSFVSFLFSCNSTKEVIPQNNVESTQKEYSVDEEEFNRSTLEVDISKEEFNADKVAILQIISELSTIMEKYDYDSWLTYIEPESIEYWSKPVNLINATKRLPIEQKIKNQKINSLRDYFRLVFIPSRQGRTVDEIRYNSRESVKAVQSSSEQDIVYYNFVKINNKWMVKLPEIQ